MISFISKALIQYNIERPKIENSEMFFYMARFSFLAFLPIKKIENRRALVTWGNIFLVIFYITFIVDCFIG